MIKNIRHSILLLVIATLALSFSCSKKVTDGKLEKRGIHFVELGTLTEVIALAELEGKPIFMDFYADWCLPCKIMTEEVFSDELIADYYNENFINYKVNGEKGNGRNLRFLYDVKGYPTLIIVDHKGKEINRNTGSMSHSAFEKFGEKAKTAFDAENTL